MQSWNISDIFFMLTSKKTYFLVFSTYLENIILKLFVYNLVDTMRVSWDTMRVSWVQVCGGGVYERMG